MKGKAVSGIMLTLLSISVLTLAFNIQPVKAEPRTIVVPDDYPTIQEAIDAANEGDTIYVKAGTYNESPSIGWKKDVTIEGASSTSTIVNGWISDYYCRGHITYKKLQIMGGICSGSAGPVAACYHNTIMNNIVHLGVWLQGIYHTVKNNVITGGLTMRGTTHIINAYCIIENNTFNGSGIQMVFSARDNKITANTITYASIGIYIVGLINMPGPGSSSNSITENNISYCGVGIQILGGLAGYARNKIFGNTITHNDYGIYLDNSNNNTIYHNNILNNTNSAYVYSSTNTWDDGYPSGGNYWSDYTGVDLFSGPYHNETGSDGIGDTPYIIDKNNQDNHPLIATPKAIDYVIQNFPYSEFAKPEEDVEDIKNDFADKFNDVIENINEGNYECATGHLEIIKEFVLEQIVESEERQRIIFMIDSLIAYLENLP